VKTNQGIVATVVLVHGYEGNGPGHWQTWLAEALGERGIAVRYPLLPDPFDPALDPWLDAVHEVLTQDVASGRVVVAHSLGCHLWAHLAERTTVDEARWADRVVLVAPPGISETSRSFPGLPPGRIDARVLTRAARSTTLVLGEDDPWRASATDYADSGLPLVRVRGGRHLNVEAGYGPWPELLDWVLGGEQRLGVEG
jgi:serine hydrolase